MKYKKIVVGILSFALIFTLGGCSSKPSDKKIKAALESGTITMEDAKSKGWINDAWIKLNFKSVNSGSKIYLFEQFQTTYIDGTPTPKNIISGKMHVVFFDSKSPRAAKKIKLLNDNYGKYVKHDIPLLGVVLDENLEGVKKRLKYIKFPVIVYNNEMKKSLKSYESMLKTDYISNWTKDGGFYSAWNFKEDTDFEKTFSRVLSDEK